MKKSPINTEPIDPRQQSMDLGLPQVAPVVYPKLLLYLPDPDAHQALTLHLSVNLSKYQLVGIGETCRPLLAKKEILFIGPEGQREPEEGRVSCILTSATRKIHFAEGVAYIVAEPRNLKLYYDSLSEPMHKVWAAIMDHYMVTIDELTTLLQTPRKSIIGYEGIKIANLFLFLCNTQYDRFSGCISANAAIYPPKTIFQNFFTFLRPTSIPEIASQTITPKASKGEQIFNFEHEAATFFPMLQTFLSTGRSPKVSLNSGFKSLGKKMKLTEFHPDDTDIRGDIRKRMYIVPLAVLPKYVGVSTTSNITYPDLLRAVVSSLQKREHIFFPLTLPHINDEYYSNSYDCHNEALIHLFLNHLKNHADEWIFIDRLKDYDIATSDNIEHTMQAYTLIDVRQSIYITPTNYYHKFEHITPNQYTTEVGLVALKSLAYMFCSLGMAELYTVPNRRRTSPYADATAIRLTNLGRYALDLTDSYALATNEINDYFAIDPDRLIIRTLISPNPYEPIIRDSAKAISANRYEVTHKSFLAKCANRSEVEAKVNSLRQVFGQELPPLWEQFFNSIYQRCNPLTADHKAYRILQLSPDNTELANLLITDPKISPLIIRAEGYRILVAESNYTKLVVQLKAHGYML